VPALIFKWRAVVALCLVSYGLGYPQAPVLSIAASALRGALAAVESAQAGQEEPLGNHLLLPRRGQQGMPDG